MDSSRPRTSRGSTAAFRINNAEEMRRLKETSSPAIPSRKLRRTPARGQKQAISKKNSDLYGLLNQLVISSAIQTSSTAKPGIIRVTIILTKVR